MPAGEFVMGSTREEEIVAETSHPLVYGEFEGALFETKEFLASPNSLA